MPVEGLGAPRFRLFAKQKSGLARMNAANIGVIQRIFAAAIFICVSSTPARSLETNDAVWAAAIDYLRSHIAMEILSRSECGKSNNLKEFGSSGFGTRIFLEEMSKYLTVEEVEHLDSWFLSNEYKALLLSTSRGVYNAIGVGSTDRSRCASAVAKYGPLLSQSKASFLDLRAAEMECAETCRPGNGVDFEENSNLESDVDDRTTTSDSEIGQSPSDVENSNVESSGAYEENSN